MFLTQLFEQDNKLVDIKLGPATATYRIHMPNDDMPEHARNTPPYMDLQSVRVPQTKRGRGCAKAIMQHVCSIADERNLPIKLLASPLDKKTNVGRLVRLYTSFGFEVTPERNFVGEPYMIRPAKNLIEARLVEKFSQVKWKWTSKSEIEWEASFRIGEIVYTVSLFRYNSTINAWELSFVAASKKKDFGFDVSGTGNAFSVFGSVIEIAKTFIKHKSPNRIKIVSDALSRARYKVNGRIAKAIADGTGYFVEKDDWLKEIFINKAKLTEGREIPSFTKLYHISPRNNLESIRKHGLDPEFSRGTKAVYLASDPSHAEGYDDHHGQNGESIMLIIDVNMLDPARLLPDDADFPDMLDDPDGDEGGKPWWDYTWQESLFLSGQCRYEGRIPPTAIEHGLNESADQNQIRDLKNTGNFVELAKLCRSVEEFIKKTDGMDVLYRGHHGDQTGDNSFMTDYVGHAKVYADDEGRIDAFAYNPNDVLFYDDRRFDEMRNAYKRLSDKQLISIYQNAGIKDSKMKNRIKRMLRSNTPYSEFCSNYEENDLFIPLLQKYALEHGKNIIAFHGGDYADYGGQTEYVVSSISKLTDLRQVYAKAKQNISESAGGIPNPKLWQEKLAPLTKQMKNDDGWSWTTGGCFAFAEAFKEAYGGELYGVCRIYKEHGETDYPVDHALVKLNGKLYDYNGVYTTKTKKNQVIKAASEDGVGWFEDDFFDDAQWKFLFDTMKQIGRSPLRETALPMDTASRMKRAQELGFTVRAYHGTGQKFNEFDLEKGRPNPLSGYAPHFSVSKAEAQGYADDANSNDNFKHRTDGSGKVIVLDCLLRVKNPFVASYHIKVPAKEFKRIVGEDPDKTRNHETSFEALRALMHSYAKKYGWEDRRKIWTLVYKRLIDLGYDAIYFPDTPADFTRTDYTKIVVFDPKNIRSVKAKFDPAQSESRNLLA